jgi:ADP-dependent NAD(P)H-hydrate dehydratase / NAD(P)H-hydrate epimerase
MTLPDWLEPLLDSSQQRALDEWAIEQAGVPGLELMERAGRGLARLVADRMPAGAVAVVCGKGNNGGDGLVVARLLREQGRDVSVLMTGAAEELRGDARSNLERLPGAPPVPFSASALAGATVVVDAILGTGFSGEPHDPAASAIEAINEASAGTQAAVFACDVPSGVNASTGEASGVAVRATATATFHAAKPGLWIAPGKAHAGEVTVVDIGIPVGGPADPEVGLIDESVTAAIPRRGAESTKFAAGSVLVCGGSPGLTGAPCMAAEAAMRAGAGYVTVCVPASLNLIFELRLLEVMTVPIPDADGRFDRGALDPVLERTERVQSLVLGPGLGRDEETLSFARELAVAASVPLLLDADGLNAHAGALESLARRSAATVLTPHAGELARLLGLDTHAVGAARLRCAREAAESSGSVVVLKGDDTLIAQPGGRVAVSRGGAAALATAGTGDVLSGVIGALLAKRMDPFRAACAGVLIHAIAGRLAGGRLGPEGVIARDVVDSLPGALAHATADGHAADARHHPLG